MVNVYPEPLNSVASAPSGGGFLCGGLDLGMGIGINSQAMCFGGGEPQPPEQLTFNSEPLTFGGESLTG